MCVYSFDKCISLTLQCASPQIFSALLPPCGHCLYDSWSWCTCFLMGFPFY